MTPDAVRVLLLAPQLPYPPEQGAAMRNYHILLHLAQRYRVTLVCFGDAADVPPELAERCERVVVVRSPDRGRPQRLADQLRPQPDLAVRLRSAAFAAAVSALTRRCRFDVVQCEALELFPYATQVPAPLVFDAHNAEWRLQQRAYQAALLGNRLTGALYSRLQWQKLRRYEAAALRRAAQTLAVSAADRDDLQRLVPAAPIAVLPNGVDAERYAPESGVPEEGDTILFAGKMDFRPNVEGALWLATQVMPLVWQQRPAARLILFGRDPAPAVRRLAGEPRISVTGHMPGLQAERQALARAAVVAVPLFSGGGTRLKVLNALAMARPLVSTPLGAAGYDVQAGRELLLARTPQQFADAVLCLLEDRTLARSLGREGMATVRCCYTWDCLLPALDRLYREVLHG